MLIYYIFLSYVGAGMILFILRIEHILSVKRDSLEVVASKANVTPSQFLSIIFALFVTIWPVLVVATYINTRKR